MRNKEIVLIYIVKMIFVRNDGKIYMVWMEDA